MIYNKYNKNKYNEIYDYLKYGEIPNRIEEIKNALNRQKKDINSKKVVKNTKYQKIDYGIIINILIKIIKVQKIIKKKK